MSINFEESAIYCISYNFILTFCNIKIQATFAFLIKIELYSLFIIKMVRIINILLMMVTFQIAINFLSNITKFIGMITLRVTIEMFEWPMLII